MTLVVLEKKGGCGVSRTWELFVMHHYVFCFDYAFAISHFQLEPCPVALDSHSRLYILTGVPNMIRKFTYEKQVWRLIAE